MSSSIQPTQLERSRLSDQITRHLEKLIISGELTEGERLPSERALMSTFGVGRPAVREALYTLNRNGLIELQNGARARVAAPKADMLLEELSSTAKYLLAQPGGEGHFRQTRLIFEVALVRYAAVNAREEDILTLEKALRANHDAIGNLDDFVRTDTEFHFVLAEIPRNPIFTAIHKAIVKWLMEQRRFVLRSEDQDMNSFKAHRKIFNAVKSGVEDSAEKAMRAHITQVYKLYDQIKSHADNR